MNDVSPTPAGHSPHEAVRLLEELAFGGGAAAAVQTAVELGVPDAIGETPTRLADVAVKTDVSLHQLTRLMRALCAYEVFTETSPGEYRHTPVSRLLRRDSEFGLSHLVSWLGSDWTWQAWQRLDDAVRSGKSVIPDIFGKEFYAYLRELPPETHQVFNKAMTQLSELSSERIAEQIAADGASVIADIGGGQGHLLATLLRLNPEAEGVLFDIDEAVRNADASLRPGGPLASRVDLVSGDCVRAIPVSADLYVLKNILHWSDESSKAILRNIARSANPGARVVVVDSVVDADADGVKVNTAKDLLLLLNFGGQLRTSRELTDLFEGAGYRVDRDCPVEGSLPALHLFEATVQA